MITLYSSNRGAWGIDLRGYFGLRARVWVAGRWKVAERRVFLPILEWVPFNAAFLASAAFFAAGVLGPGNASQRFSG